MSMAAAIAAFLAAIACDFAVPETSPPICGGEERVMCPWGQTCEDDPDDDCDPLVGGKRCPGLCETSLCGGLLGLVCSQGQVCVDDPGDSCDPKHGGADCIGQCQDDGPASVGCDSKDRTFVSHDLDLCDQIQFICEVGWIPFYDQCGCGCMIEDE